MQKKKFQGRGWQGWLLLCLSSLSASVEHPPNHKLKHQGYQDTRIPTPLQMSKQYKSPTVTVHLNGRNFIGNEGGTAYYFSSQSGPGKFQMQMNGMIPNIYS